MFVIDASCTVAVAGTKCTATTSGGGDFDWQIFSTLLVGALAFIGVIVTIVVRWKADTNAVNQKTDSDNMSEWWRRAEWAIDRSNSSEIANSEAGIIVLTNLLESPLATKAEHQMLLDVGMSILKRVP